MIARSHKGIKVTIIDNESSAKLRERLWRYLPPVLWTALIFFASTANFSASNTSSIVRTLLLWLFPDITKEGLLYAHFMVRKAAHFIEYAMLALLLARAFRSSSRKILREWWFAAAFGFVTLVALLDEFHQSFLAARTGTIYDSFLDMTGGATALALVALWRSFYQRKRRGIS